MIFRQFEVERAQTLREMCRVVPYLEEKHVTILVTREWHEIITKGVYPKDAGTETEKFLDSISTADCADFTKKFEEFSRTRVPFTVPVSWKAEIDRLRCWEAEIDRLGELLQVALRGEDYKTAAALKSQQLEILGILAQCPTPAAEMSKLLVLENEAAAVKDYERATAIKAALEALCTIAPKEGVDRGPQSSFQIDPSLKFIQYYSTILFFIRVGHRKARLAQVETAKQDEETEQASAVSEQHAERKPPTMVGKVRAIKEQLGLDSSLPIKVAVQEANKTMCIEATGTIAEQVDELLSRLPTAKH